MRRLFPDGQELELDEFHAGLTLRAGEQRSWVAIGMVSSLDGAASVAGVTADLGGAADRRVFGRLRAAADAILVGAGTVRAESYGPGAGTAERRADRRARGLAERPRLVIVTRSLDLAPDHRVFSDPQSRPLVVTAGSAPSEREEALHEVADVRRLGGREVDLPALLRLLAAEGLPRVLCEGGPHLNGHLLAEDLVDEVFLTLAPVAVGGTASRITVGESEVAARGFTVVSVHEHDGELLLRYRRTSRRDATVGGDTEEVGR